MKFLSFFFPPHNFYVELVGWQQCKNVLSIKLKSLAKWKIALTKAQVFYEISSNSFFFLSPPEEREKNHPHVSQSVRICMSKTPNLFPSKASARSCFILSFSLVMMFSYLWHWKFLHIWDLKHFYCVMCTHILQSQWNRHRAHICAKKDNSHREIPFVVSLHSHSRIERRKKFHLF
jgi:hypothetical protein